MYLTQSNVIRGLSKEEYSILRETCQYSNNLYNVALYNIRQYYFQDKKFLKYEENYHGEFSFQVQDPRRSCGVLQQSIPVPFSTRELSSAGCLSGTLPSSISHAG